MLYEVITVVTRCKIDIELSFRLNPHKRGEAADETADVRAEGQGVAEGHPEEGDHSYNFV